ncbi:MAG: universal stress protein [Gemmatimonadales bacterium]
MKILLATDGLSHSRNAVDLLKRIPLASPGNDVRVLVVVPTTRSAERSAKRALRIALRRKGENLARGEALRLQDAGCAVHTVLLEGHVAECIIDTAEQFRAELVVVGSRGLSGARRFLLGSVSQKTMKYAPCSVLVTRQPSEPTSSQGMTDGAPLRILVAFDSSQSAQAAVENVASLPLLDDTEITIMTTLPLIRHFRTAIIQTTNWEWWQRKKAAKAALESAALVLRRATPHVATKLREASDETKEILKVADELNTDIIVLGHKGKSEIKRFLLRSVSNRVTHHAKCSVWVVRRPSRTSRQD